jgi:hypothetical protein
MFGTTRGILVPARKRLLAFSFALIAATPVAAMADDGLVDVRTLPRLEGAIEDTARTQSYSLNYGVPAVVAVTSVAIRKLLAADGWVSYVRPLEETSGSLVFRKGKQGLFVSLRRGWAGPTNR